MNSDIKNFIIRLVVLSGILLIAGVIIFTCLLPGNYFTALPFTLLLFIIVTASVHIYQIILIRKNIAVFARSSMVTTMLKLAIYSLFTLTFLFLYRENAIPFVITVFLLYLIFTLFEVSELTRLNRRISQKGN